MRSLQNKARLILALTAVFFISLSLTYKAKATEFVTTDIQYEDDYENSTYYLTENGDLFVSLNYEDNKRPLRLATDVSKIKYDNSHRILYMIKNDNSLWVRGYNIYLKDINDSSFWEFTKIDDNVEDVFFSDSMSHYWLYKKTDDSLWLIGNSAELNLYSVDKGGSVCSPVKIADDVKEAVNTSNIFVLKNDSSLYTVIDDRLEKIKEGIKSIRTVGGYGYDYEYILTDNKELYIMDSESKDFDNACLIGENVDSFDVQSTYAEDTTMYIIRSGSLYKVNFSFTDSNGNIDLKALKTKEEKIMDNVTDVRTYGEFAEILTNNKELYRIFYDFITSEQKFEKSEGDYIKLFGPCYALSSEGKGVMLFDDQDIYDDFDFNTNGTEFIDKSYSEWAKEEIDKAIHEDIVPAFLQREYKTNISREEFCTLAVNTLMRKLNTNTDRYMENNNIVLDENRFVDTDRKDVLLAEALGLVSGYDDNTFRPDENITRQEAAVLLNNLFRLMQIKENKNNSLFSDDDKIGDWAKKSVYTVNGVADRSGNLVMSGVGGGKFDPQGYYTREQAILTLYRIFNI